METSERGASTGGQHTPGIHALDSVRAAVWQAYRHLFPPHSRAAQTDQGSIVISWSTRGDPDASHPYAAPVLLRLDEGLLQQLRNSDAVERKALAARHEPALRVGLRGYDPFVREPKARVVVLG